MSGGNVGDVVLDTLHRCGIKQGVALFPSWGLYIGNPVVPEMEHLSRRKARLLQKQIKKTPSPLGFPGFAGNQQAVEIAVAVLFQQMEKRRPVQIHIRSKIDFLAAGSGDFIEVLHALSRAAES